MDKIYVSRPYLPKKEIYEKYLGLIWEKKQLTNNGTLVLELEKKLKKYLGVRHLFYVANGTIALQIAIKALGITGKIITTPFSFVASVNSIIWENCTPIFADIDEKTLCLDPAKIEKVITKNTQAIMAVHVFGYPCDVRTLSAVAGKYGLKIIYDGAHAFGTKIGTESVFKYGDISTCSLHATKFFHSGEGGIIVTDDDKLAEKISQFRSFGFEDSDYYTYGINAKNSEFHAALGLCNFEKIESILRKNKKICALYDSYFQKAKLLRPATNGMASYNYAYYPLIFSSAKKLMKVKDKLEKNNIFPRRYFYPSLNRLAYIKRIQKCPVSESISERILCLPLYYDLTLSDVRRIVKIVMNSI